MEGFLAIHFESTIFCWLPPESMDAGPPPRIPKRALNGAAIASSSSSKKRDREGSAMLRSTSMSRMRPCDARSSGT